MPARSSTPILIACSVVATATLATNLGASAATTDRSAIQKFNAQVLHTTTGIDIHPVYEPGSKTVRAFINEGNRQVAPKNGTYNIASGGSIKVNNGVIVWDAFGVIAKLTAGDAQALNLLPA